jgi:YVTN family beta-propeller protein
MTVRMRKVLVVTVCTATLLFSCGKNASHVDPIETRSATNWQSVRVGPQPAGGHIVATEQLLTPVGRQIPLRGRLSDLALSPDEKLLAVKASTGVAILDAATGEIRQRLTMKANHELMAPAAVSELGAQSFTGIAWDAAGREIYCPDTYGQLWIAEQRPDALFQWTPPIVMPGPGGNYRNDTATPKTSAPGGLTVDGKRNRIYLALSRNNSIGVIDRKSRKILRQVSVGNVPYTVVVHEGVAYVSNWGGRKPRPGDKTMNSSGTEIVVDPATGVPSTGTVSVVDLESLRVTKEVEVGLHPSGMTLSRDGSLLYVANSNSDSISVIDTAHDTVAKTISVKPAPEIPTGSTPAAVAISLDGSRLFVAMAGLNAIAVVDVAQSKVLGMIPVGWYPAGVQIDAASSKLYIANLKGVGGRLRDFGLPAWDEADGDTDKFKKHRDPPGYNSHDDTGTVTFAPIPDEAALAADTLTVARNTRLPEMQAALLLKTESRVVPVPTSPGETSVFKHVIYVIKENQAYDSVFGDLPQGNGEPKLLLLGREASPNHHALAEEFVLFDSLYCNGTLSAEGHLWTNTGLNTDYTERSTGAFGRSYPFEGTDPMTFSPAGFIWDGVLSKGLSFRNYGEFVTWPRREDLPFRKELLAEAASHRPTWKADLKIALHTIRPYTSRDYPGFDPRIPDVYRLEVFLKEFREFEQHGNFPSLVLMTLPQDHTAGMAPGYPTERAMMADNDLALGRLVEAVSKSEFWKDTAIFVIEDDSQNGLDHVDGRRTIGFAISAYTRRHAVDSTFYNHNSILRTMELILGLPPMTQFDLMANPMTAAFQSTPDFTPYTARSNHVPLDEMNKPVAELSGTAREYALESLKPENLMRDGGDEEVKNRIAWFAAKGPGVPYPERRHRDGRYRFLSMLRPLHIPPRASICE